MKHLLSILLICSLSLSQELTVEGDLNVTGNIQNQTIDSLQQVIQDLQAQLSAMQGQGGLQTRLYDLPTITWTPIAAAEYPLDIIAITGYDLTNVIVKIHKVNDFSLYTDQSVALVSDAKVVTHSMDHGGNINSHYGSWADFGNDMDYIISQNNQYIVGDNGYHFISAGGSHVGGSVNLTISITALYPN